MIVCKNCNKENEAGAVYCENCGNKLRNPSEQDQNLESISKHKTAKPTTKLLMIITAFFFVVIFLYISTYFLQDIKPKSKQTKVSSVGENINTGMKQPQIKKLKVVFIKDDILWIYNSDNKSMQQIFQNKEESIHQIACSPNGKYIAIVNSSDSKSRNLKVLSLESKKFIEIGNGEQPVWFPDSSKLLFSEPSGIKKVFYLNNEKSLILDSSSNANSRLSISPDSQRLIIYNPYSIESNSPREEIFIANFNDQELDKQNALWIFDYSTKLEWKDENTFFAEKPSGGSGGNDIYEITIINGNEFKSKYVEFGSGAIISPDSQYFVFQSKQYYEDGGNYSALAVHSYETNKTNIITPIWPNGMGSADPNHTFWQLDNYKWLDSDQIIFSKSYYQGSDDIENNQPIKIELWIVKKDGTDLEKITDMDNKNFSVGI